MSAEKARGDAPDTNGYLGPAAKETGTGTANTAGGAVGGPGSDQRTDEQTEAPALPVRGGRPAATDDPNDTGVESMTAPGDSSKQSRPSTNLPPLSGETGAPGSDQRTDEQFAGPAPPGDRPIAAEGQDFQHDTGVESRPAPGDAGKQTRPITNLPLSGETAGQVQSSASGTEV